MDTDIIVVGGGSAGAAVANRLSEDGNLDVTLIEAGGSDRHPFVRVPAGSSLAIASEKLNWMYEVQPDQSRDQRVDYWPAGKVLGGGSSINGMMFVRGHREDYDAWAEGGATGWDYANVLPYFRRLESNESGPNEFRGNDGPQSVSNVRVPHQLTDAWHEACINAGIQRNEDLNGSSQEGVGYCQASQRGGWRHSTATAYIWPVRGRKNLHLLLNTVVHRILMDGSRAVGVELADGKQILANRGVVVSAGAIGTPKLLMASGVGPKAQLEDLGIETAVDNSNVGQNLQEHAAVLMSWHVKIESLGSSMNPLKNLMHGLNFVFRGRGPLSTPIGHAHAFVRTTAAKKLPNVQIIMSPFSYDFNEKGATLYSKPSVGIAVGLARADTRGAVALRSADPADRPVIDYQLLGSANEVRQLIDGCRIARSIVEQEPFRSLVIDERMPGADHESDEQLEAFIRSASFPMYHVCGTCRMGSDKDAVTSPTLQVHGSQSLWVVDASVIPSIPAGNINATVIMIGEKGADHIKNALAEGAVANAGSVV